MRIALLTEDAVLFALRPAWEALWRRAPAATPFQSPAWMLSWWRCFGTGRPVVAVALSQSQTGLPPGEGQGEGPSNLAGLLACYLLDEPEGRKLLPMGAGITDYQDAVLAPDAPPETAERLLATVLETARQAGAASCDFTDLPPRSALRAACAPPSWRDESQPADPCPVLTLPAKSGRLGDIVPAGKLRDVRQSLHRAERIGGSSMEIATTETGPMLLGSLVGMHETRWRASGQSGVLCDPRVVAFHRLAVPALLASGALRLQILRLGNRVAGAYYALIAGDRVLFYLSAYDPVFARESPGTILLAHMIEDALREGRRELHFLRGGEAYKSAWGATDRFNVARRLTPP